MCMPEHHSSQGYSYRDHRSDQFDTRGYLEYWRLLILHS